MSPDAGICSTRANSTHSTWPTTATFTRAVSHLSRAPRYTVKMTAVAIPPFERFYEAHRDEIFAFLVRRLGRERAEDAFQETFLRALRGYAALSHGEHLRAWACTIASRVSADELRRRGPPAQRGEPATVDERPAYAELEHLAADLPPTERAAVVLRYGYDLDYADIGAALGSTAEAARQARSRSRSRFRPRKRPPRSPRPARKRARNRARVETAQRETVGKPPEEPPPRPEVTTLVEVGGVLTPPGYLRLEPYLEFTHTSLNRVNAHGIVIENVFLLGQINAFQSDRDTLLQSITARYGFTNRFEADFTVPGLYRNERSSTQIPGATQTDPAEVHNQNLTEYGLGDIEGGFHYQINSGANGWPFFVGNLRWKSDTGKGPFDVSYDSAGFPTELATGSGFWSVNPSLTLIAPAGPAVLFGNIGYLWNLEPNVNKQISSTQIVTKADPGNAIQFNVGLGVALTEDLSFNLGFDYNFIRPTDTVVDVIDQQSGMVLQTVRLSSSEYQIGSLQFGVGYRFSDHLSAQVNAQIGATDDAPDFRISLRVPISMQLFNY